MIDYFSFNETMVKGLSHKIDFRVKRKDTGANVNVSSYPNFRFTAKDSAADADAALVFTKTLGAGITKEDATNGLLEVTIAAADTSALPDGQSIELVAELQGVDDTALPYSLARGRITVLPRVSRTNP